MTLLHIYSINILKIKENGILLSQLLKLIVLFLMQLSNPDEVWQLKIDSIYKPNPIVMGTKIETDSSIIEKKLNTTEFGYRKLEADVLRKFIKNISGNQNHDSNNTTNINIRLNSLLSSLEPVKPIKGHNYLYGPFIFTDKRMTKFDNKQDEISEKLSYRMHDNIRRKYSLYG